MSTVASELPSTAPLFEGRKSVLEQSLVIAFMIIPVAALAVAVTLAWGWGLTLLDVVIATIAYFGTGLGVTVGFHRHFTHKSFKAVRPLKVALAITGSLAFQGSIVSWVADHRRHHAFSDKEGDPHSPWLFGTGPIAIARGFWHAHMGWLFDRDKTNARRFAPDLLADRDVAAVDRQFVLLTVVSLGIPALLGGLLSWSWWGASPPLEMTVHNFGDQALPRLPTGGLVRWLGTRGELHRLITSMGYSHHFLYASNEQQVGQWLFAHGAGGSLRGGRGEDPGRRRPARPTAGGRGHRGEDHQGEPAHAIARQAGLRAPRAPSVRGSGRAADARRAHVGLSAPRADRPERMSAPLSIALEDVRAAAVRVGGVAHRTPVMTSRALDALVGARVFLKLESLQRVGAFKFRGAYNAISSLPAEVRARGVCTVSSGNHAQAVTLAAGLCASHAVILMPSDAPELKRAATEGYGAEVVISLNRYRDDHEQFVRELAAERGLAVVHPFDDPLVMAGQETVALELLEQAGELDAVVAPVGGGGLISGCATVVKALLPRARMLGVEPAASDDVARSLASGRRERVEVGRTIADGQQTDSPASSPGR